MSIFICIISAFFWAAFDLTRKLSLQKINSVNLLLIFTLAQTFIFGGWVFYENPFLNLKSYIFPGIILILISLFSALLFLKAIKQSDLSLTIPLLSLSPLFSSFFSFFFLNEKLSYFQYIGVFLIIFGTLVLYSRKITIGEILKSFKILVINNSARLMIVVSLIWSLTPVLDKLCLEHSSINIHGLIQSFGLVILLIFLLKKEKIEFFNLKKNWGLILITILTGIIATVLQFYSILLNYVPIMEAIKRSIGQLSSVFFGKLFFKEKITKPKLLGVLILSFGVFYIL
ncbi:MAG: hypothetical protein CMM92_02040 [Rickettsiales bacterium]|nr:hypothetical protein [Rickettsiales bacterium]RPG15231.1 MAG: hypothetical protein CBD55_002035 [Pelagibacteraceae bacterium TMED195]|tara:strand:- start:264 stop:1121 length:858 start_codon:yes stop_codon:yes gene_type:complete